MNNRDFTCLKGRCVPSCYLINYGREKSSSKFKSGDYDDNCTNNNILSNKSIPPSEKHHGGKIATVRLSKDTIDDNTMYDDKTTMSYIDDKYDGKYIIGVLK